MPNSQEFELLVKNDFSNYRLRVGGLVDNPAEFSYAALKAMPKQEQITTHFCIQGWSGVAKWGGVPMRHILELVRPTAEARYAVLTPWRMAVTVGATTTRTACATCVTN